MDKKQVKKFHHIHVHSEFSVLDGFGTIEEYVAHAVKNGMGYLALTDHGVCGGWPKLLDLCEKNGIRPVFGSELYLNDYNHLIKSVSTLGEDMKIRVRKANHVILLAETETGFENIIKLSSMGWNGGMYYKPRVSRYQIAEHKDGIYVTSACLAGSICYMIDDYMKRNFQDIERRNFDASHVKFVYKSIMQNKSFVEELENEARWWKDTFGSKFYIEWQMLNLFPQCVCNKFLYDLCKKLNIEPVVTNDVHYLKQEDAYLQSIQLLLSSKGTFNNPYGLQFDSDEIWFTLEEDMDKRWEDFHRQIIGDDEFYERSKENTLLISQACGYVYPDREPKLPVVENAGQILKEKCEKSLRLHGLDNEEYRKRLDEELGLIRAKDFESYFLIQQEIIEYVKNELKEPVGPGRGSVGGCLVAYLLGITKIDPVKHNLLFSRFLSPSRGGKQMKLTV